MSEYSPRCTNQLLSFVITEEEDEEFVVGCGGDFSILQL
jgi:hypothetical protein